MQLPGSVIPEETRLLPFQCDVMRPERAADFAIVHGLCAALVGHRVVQGVFGLNELLLLIENEKRAGRAGT